MLPAIIIARAQPVTSHDPSDCMQKEDVDLSSAWDTGGRFLKGLTIMLKRLSTQVVSATEKAQEAPSSTRGSTVNCVGHKVLQTAHQILMLRHVTFCVQTWLR